MTSRRKSQAKRRAKRRSRPHEQQDPHQFQEFQGKASRERPDRRTDD
ncbi:MAG: hypothetical protein QM747_05005 [Nocardioides sp.]